MATEKSHYHQLSPASTSAYVQRCCTICAVQAFGPSFGETLASLPVEEPPLNARGPLAGVDFCFFPRPSVPNHSATGQHALHII
eukprot:1143597-Pelagomonas_calceolata.AAC.4